MRFFLITIIFYSLHSICNGQNKYKLDYFLLYNETIVREKDTLKQQKIYLTNSNDNSYFIKLYELDSLNYNLIFVDRNQLQAKVIVKKSEFFKGENIIIDCHYVSRYRNPNKNQIKNYEFVELGDTIFKDYVCSSYKLQSTLKRKKIIKEKIGSIEYYIDKSTSFHLPILDFDTVYEECKEEGNIPNGIFVKKSTLNYYGNESRTEEFELYSKINKYVIVTDICN